MLMLDLGAGKGGASAAFRERGWEVITLDIDPAFNVDIVADVLTWEWTGLRPDLIWFSMPCTEFARESMPWCKTGTTPDTSLVEACLRIVDNSKPRFWIGENVKGSIKWLKPILGTPRLIELPFIFWGFFPMPGRIDRRGWIQKQSLSSTQAADRAIIPHSLSNAFALAIERQEAMI